MSSSAKPNHHYWLRNKKKNTNNNNVYAVCNKHGILKDASKRLNLQFTTKCCGKLVEKLEDDFVVCHDCNLAVYLYIYFLYTKVL